MIPGIPFNLSIGGAIGDADGDPIPVGGIKESDYLVAVIRHDASAGEIEGLDITDFTVTDGNIEAATIDTTGYQLAVIWSDNGPPVVSS